MTDSGTYALVIALEATHTLRAGKLDAFNFAPGYYVYVGSAMSGLSGRLKRHLRSEKQLHWHIDYLLQHATIVQLWYSFCQHKLECTWNTIIMNLPGAAYPIPEFGASDCRCISHLTCFPSIPSFNIFSQKLRQNKLPEVYKLDITEGTPVKAKLGPELQLLS